MLLAFSGLNHSACPSSALLGPFRADRCGLEQMRLAAKSKLLACENVLNDRDGGWTARSAIDVR